MKEARIYFDNIEVEKKFRLFELISLTFQNVLNVV